MAYAYWTPLQSSLTNDEFKQEFVKIYMNVHFHIYRKAELETIKRNCELLLQNYKYSYCCSNYFEENCIEFNNILDYIKALIANK